jgi:hypothetical protein
LNLTCVILVFKDLFFQMQLVPLHHGLVSPPLHWRNLMLDAGGGGDRAARQTTWDVTDEKGALAAAAAGKTTPAPMRKQSPDGGSGPVMMMPCGNLGGGCTS